MTQSDGGTHPLAVVLAPDVQGQGVTGAIRPEQTNLIDGGDYGKNE